MIGESIDSRTAAMTGRLAFLQNGVGVARLRIYGNTRPLAVTDAPGADPLVEITLATPPGSVANGELTLAAAAPGDVLQSGDASWVRVVNGDGATAFDMDAGGKTSGKECILSDAALWAGGLVSILSAVLG